MGDLEDLVQPSNVWLLIVGGTLLIVARAVMIGGNLRRAGQLVSLTTPTPERY